jgi:flagellar basal body-associated protein FliL
MSVSREEVEKTVTDFQKISSRPETKLANGNIKIILIITVIVICVLVVGGYLYMRKGKVAKAGKKGPEVAAAGVPTQTPAQQANPVNITV